MLPSALQLPIRLTALPLLLAVFQSTLAQDAIPKHDTFTLESKALGETRRINVWIPPNRNGSPAELPVLYMPDGGVREDFPHIAGTIAELVEDGSLAPLCVVGIENTVRRRDLTGPSTEPSDAKIAPITDGASVFRTFIRAELFPEVERRYPVSEQRAIVGESAAGLFVVETFFLQPDMFQTYIAMDPALYWNNRELVRRAEERLRKIKDLPRTLWFTSSGAQDILPHTDRLATLLKAHAPSGLKWTYTPYPEERHTTIFRATKKEAFRSSLWKKE